jgi:universal stress protein A
MADYNKVLVAVDGSDESEKIIDKAVAVAADSNAEIDVVLVFEPLLGSYSFELNMADFEKVQKQHQTEISEKMKQMLAARTPTIPGDRVHFLYGKPAKEIKKLAKELDTDLLVIGSHGHSPITAVLGSTANSVLHGIHCDVLTIRV